MFRCQRFAALLIPCFSMTLFCEAEDLGTVGKTWPIEEPDLFTQIATKLEEYQRSGRLSELNEHFAQRANASIEHPTRVIGISRTTIPRVFYHDPSITIQQDIITPDGQVLARKGDQLNPLDHIPMNQHLLFFDGNDSEQLSWAKEQLNFSDHQLQISLILIDGSAIELSKQWEQQIFFDQQGVLTTRFEIRQVPASVSRDGNLLRIEEVEP